MADLLIELFSEEIPARMQKRAAEDLKRLMTDGLVEAGLTYASAGHFATPRRLTLAVEGLSAQSPATREERKGPRTDAPDKAIEGFLRSTGLTLDQLERRPEKKGEAFFAVIEKPGRPAEEIVAETLARTIADFPWPKSMRWGAGTLRWVRPLHSIICLLTDEAGARIVPLEIGGITAGDTTRGHRFMAPGEIRVTGFEDYAGKLQAAKVMLDPAERMDAIRQEAEGLAFARGWQLVADDALLAEVAGLVEWPVPLMGAIEARFLDLPPEVLRTSMKEHQKFFSARNPKTGRIEGFVTVANIEAEDGGEAILRGNQRVLAARLSDAAFFWENDLRIAATNIRSWQENLAAMTYHRDLGSQLERTARVTVLATEIAARVNANVEDTRLAAAFSKLDLVSQMVGEFPELQGRMGGYYAKAYGLSDDASRAVAEQYAPKGSSDLVPDSLTSVVLGLADRLDSLVALWAAGERVKGSGDPFALRRSALGIIRLVLSAGLRLELKNAIGISNRRAWASILKTGAKRLDEELRLSFMRSVGWLDSDAVPEKLGLDASRAADLMGQGFGSGVPLQEWEIVAVEEVLAFLHDRLKVHLREQGIRHDVIDAVLALPGNDDLVAVVARATALSDMLKTPDGENLVQGLRRAENILTQAEEKDGVEYSFGPDPKLAQTEEERALFAALDAAEPAIARATKAEDFPAAMTAIAALRAPIDAFFEAVQVNTDNAMIRRNRLNLLHRIRAAGQGIADFTRLEG